MVFIRLTVVARQYATCILSLVGPPLSERAHDMPPSLITPQVIIIAGRT